MEKVFSELTEGYQLRHMCICVELVPLGENRCLEGCWRGLMEGDASAWGLSNRLCPTL